MEKSSTIALLIFHLGGVVHENTSIVLGKADAFVAWLGSKHICNKRHVLLSLDVDKQHVLLATDGYERKRFLVEAWQKVGLCLKGICGMVIYDDSDWLAFPIID